MSFFSEHKRNVLASVIAGVMFFSGWWIIFDVAASYPDSEDFSHNNHLCGVFGTLGFVLVNMVSNEAVRGTGYSDGRGAAIARLILFFGFLIAFGSVIGASSVLFMYYADPETELPIWPGLGLFFQNVLIFSASMVFKFGRTDEDSYF